MSNAVIQTSFNAGEWAPALNARVDLAKYHAGASLLRNFFVDYRGGATTRPGSRYIAKTYTTSTTRIIRFQASFTVSYVLEFGSGYIRFFNNGAPILEAGKTITGVTQANPGVVSSTAHGFAVNDWVVISGVVGMTQLNGNTYVINTVPDVDHYTLKDLFGNVINTTTFSGYTSGGIAQRVYTLFGSPYTDAEVFGIKYAQNINQLILCHPNHPPYVLTIITATNWTIAPITFASTITSPVTPTVTTTLAAGTVNYAYVVTAVDANGQESAISAFGVIGGIQDIRSVGGTNTVTWSTVTDAVSYNIYRAVPRYGAAVPAGSQFGFVGNVNGLTFIDSNITPDFSQGPPLVVNPFSGSGVVTVQIGATGSYGGGVVVPSVSFSGGGGSGATAFATAFPIGSVTVNTGGAGYTAGEFLGMPGTNGATLQVGTVGIFGDVTSVVRAVPGGGLISGVTTPTNPVATSPATTGSGCTVSLTWGILSVSVTSPGTGYATPPTVAFSSGAASATAVIGAPSSGNPTAPGFFQQRLVLAGPVSNPLQFNMSQPGSYFNFNVTDPIAPDNAFQGVLVTGQLNTIQSMIPMPSGLVVLTDKGAWLINGGSPGSAVSATSVVANSQAYNGSSFLQPIIANYDILYVQAKGSIVRDLTYNFYTNIFTGSDISILSSHLFYGFTIVDWAWAEEPFKLVWAVRNDGIMLTLTFQKDQEMVAWAHSDTLGAYTSVVTITEAAAFGTVDAVYNIVQRLINNQAVQYIERFVELTYPLDYKSSWQVDAGIGYNSTPAVTFSGAQHLGGQVVTGVADGTVINFTMPVSGTFVFGGGGTPGLTGIANASVVTVGLAFLPQIGTLALDLGEPTVQSKRKKVSAVTLRTKDALGLTAGRNLDTCVPLQDLILGNVGTMTNAIVTGLVTSDARVIVDPQWDVFGQYFIQQPNPYPATILGIIPEIEVGDTSK